MEYRCTVVRRSDLDETCYVFCMIQREVVLDAVYVHHRASRRHKWRTVGKWAKQQMPDRVPTMAKPTVPEDVIAEVRKDLSELRIVV